MEIPDVPPPLLAALIEAAAGQRLALVGGAVRDLLLHRHHQDPWRGLPDLDLVVEGRASDLVARLPAALQRAFAGPVGLTARDHDRFGTQELELLLPPCHGGPWLLDVASARRETYPQPAENPLVSLGALDQDLARRDLTVNAIALELATGDLLDPHGGQADLARRELRFLHGGSLRDDPTRLVRAARYAARLHFALSAEAHAQARATLAAWPWGWRPGDAPGQAPAALGTRLRMELELLLEREPWVQALTVLQGCGGLALLDAQVQQDRTWRRRLCWAQRFGLPPLAALVAGARDPVALAERLQLPHRVHRLLAQLQHVQTLLQRQPEPVASSAEWWCQLLEAPGVGPEAVALALASGVQPRRPLLRWLLRWRHLKPALSAQQLMEREGLRPGPALGERLRALRAERLRAERR